MGSFIGLVYSLNGAEKLRVNIADRNVVLTEDLMFRKLATIHGLIFPQYK